MCKFGELSYIPETHTQLLPSLSEKVGMLSQFRATTALKE